jgi:hypothetical protein
MLKEARDLLPLFIATALLMVVPFCLWPHHADALGIFGVFAYGLGCALMAGSAFGGELHYRTFSLLLSQPVPRAVLWREKMLALGLAMTGAYGVLVVCLAGVGEPGGAVESSVLWLLGLIALCAFCGTPYGTLQAGSGIGGAVFSAAAPGAICGIGALVLGYFFPDVNPVPILVGLVVVYCALIYWLGYRKFKTVEIVEGTTRELALPARLDDILAGALSRLGPRGYAPFRSLLKKELRLQQVSFLLFGLACVVAVGALSIWWLRPDVAEGLLGGDVAIYVIITPFIAGALAVAEERGWGVSEWHLTLPASALKQWCAKMLVTLPTSLLLGLVIPSIVAIGARWLFGPPIPRGELPPPEEVVPIVLAQLLATTLAVYTATICKNTIWAILAAFGMVAAGIGVFFQAVRPVEQLAHGRTLGALPEGTVAALAWFIACAGLLLVVCLLQWFAWSNFRRFGLGRGRFGLQLVAIFALVGLMPFVFLAAIYLVLAILGFPVV